MKQIKLIVLAFLVPLITVAQQADGIKFRYKATDSTGLTPVWTVDSSFANVGSLFGDGKGVNIITTPGDYYISLDYDTLPAIMLVSDTSLHEYNSTSRGYDMVYYTYLDFDYSVRWRYGYVVVPLYRTGFYNEIPGNKYLDENKNPMPKNIVVWMLNTLNNKNKN